MKTHYAELSLSEDRPSRKIPEKYISVALDTSQIMGGYWWDNSDAVKNGLGDSRVEPLNLGDERLIFLTRFLQPRCIRFGGTEADRVFYSLKKKQLGNDLPEGYHYALDRRRWKDMEGFCRKTGASLMLTVNAGPGPRRDKNRWRKKNARHLIRYAEAREHTVSVWELGNEVNAYAFFLGYGNRLTAGEYAEDMHRLKRAVSPDSGALTAGPALAVWPLIGETLPFMTRFLKKAGDSLDLITWHYYPQQSFRSPLAIRRARRGVMLKPGHLDEGGRQARRIIRKRDRYQPGVPVWLGETGHALCGGEPGLSDTFYSGFWWLDQLGIMAREGMDQVIRQTLIGGDYGLLDKDNLSPLPDYWTTVLWQRYVGKKVFRPAINASSPCLRFYLHSLKGVNGGFCLITINLSDERAECRVVEGLPPVRERLILTTSDIYSRKIFLNDVLLREQHLPDLPAPERVDSLESTILPPLSYGFLLLYRGTRK